MMIRVFSLLAVVAPLLLGACSWRDIGQFLYNSGKAYTDNVNGGGNTGNGQPD